MVWSLFINFFIPSFLLIGGQDWEASAGVLKAILKFDNFNNLSQSIIANEVTLLLLYPLINDAVEF